MPSARRRANESTNRLILGIDPGLTATGHAIIDAADPSAAPVALGDVRTASRDPLGKRLAKIHDELAALVERHRPAMVAVESLFTHVNVKTALQMAQARGVALLAATAHGAELFEYAPREISGRANKAQMISMIRALVEIPRRRQLSDHMADALAVAICHRQHLQVLATGRTLGRRSARRSPRRQWQEHLENREA
jgi:crossover junction endodeoxyribonuclease RuvC